MKAQERFKGRKEAARDAEALAAKKKRNMLIAGAAAAVAVVAIVLAIAFWPRGGEFIDKRDPATMQGDNRAKVEAQMQKAIDAATARGDSKEDIERLRASYLEHLKSLPKN